MEHKTTIIVILALVLVAVGFARPAAAAPVVYFDFDLDGNPDSDVSLATGDTLVAPIFISGIDDTHGGLVSWGVEVGFYSGSLLGTDFGVDPAWPIVFDGSAIDNASGQVDFGAATLFGAHTGTIYMGYVFFDAISGGLFNLSLGNMFSDDPDFVGFIAADSFVYDDTIDFQSAMVTVVPLPASILLLGFGLFGMAGFIGKRRLTVE